MRTVLLTLNNRMTMIDKKPTTENLDSDEERVYKIPHKKIPVTVYINTHPKKIVIICVL